jgi:hypothetical protein
MGYFDHLNPKARAKRRQETWKQWEETVRQLLAEINGQVFDGAGRLRAREFDGQRMGLELTNVDSLVPSAWIRVGVSYDPDIFEVSADGMGCVEKEWSVEIKGGVSKSEINLVASLQEALLYVEPAIVSMADRR